MSDHNEALRLADELVAPIGTQTSYQTAHEAAALIRKQAERIAELEARVHTCGPTCSKAGCINRRLTSERDTLRAEVERLRRPLTDDEIEAIAQTVRPIVETGYPSWGNAVARAIESAKEQQ